MIDERDCEFARLEAEKEAEKKVEEECKEESEPLMENE